MVEMVKEIEVHADVSDKAFAKHEGTFFTTKGMRIFTDDVDVYAISHPDDIALGHPRRKLLLKFRKNVFSKEQVQIGWDAFRFLAIPSRNRGAAAGPIDLKGEYWKHRNPVEISKWEARYKQPDGSVSKMMVNNTVASGVIGNYERTPFMGAPCRLTAYTRRNLKYYLRGIPFLEAIDGMFKKLVPDAHAKQKSVVSARKMYQIGDTAFSTLTVNMNFRTALHKDAGDYHDGFGNLSVIEWGRYHGGETMFPRYKVGFDLRSGDFVAMDVHEWHCNAALYATAEDTAFNRTLPDIRTRNPETGVIGSQELYQRLSFVCYFREKLEECKESETREYYKANGFDLRKESAVARRHSLSSLPIPGITGTLEEAIAVKGRGLSSGHGTRKKKIGRRSTEKQRRVKHFM